MGAQGGDGGHDWVGASAVALTERQARLALLRGVLALPGRARFNVLDVYCRKCRRPYEDVGDQPCSADIDNSHLRGGPVEDVRRHRPAAMQGQPLSQTG